MSRTFKDDLAADAEATFLNPREFGEAVTQLVGGDEGQSHETTAVFVATQPDREYDERGHRLVERPRLHVSAALALDLDDKWIVRGKRYAVTSVGREAGGLVPVELVAFERVTTRAPAGR